MSKAKPDAFAMLLHVTAEDAQLLHTLSMDFKRRGLIRRVGVKPGAEVLLHKAIETLKGATTNALLPTTIAEGKRTRIQGRTPKGH